MWVLMVALVTITVLAKLQVRRERLLWRYKHSRDLAEVRK